MEKETSRVRSVANWILGLLVVILGIAFMGFCQLARGELRPYVPHPFKSWIDAGGGLAVEDYLESVPRAFSTFVEERERCAKTRDQHCLTQAEKKLRDDIGPAVPAEASWMAASHSKLFDALERIVRVHERAEAGERSDALTTETFAAVDHLRNALVEWQREAER